jgi:hypothetical protein
MRVREDRVAFGLGGQWAMVKGCFPAGAYTLKARGAGPGIGDLRVVSLEAGEVGRFPLRGETAGPFTLKQPGKYLFYLYLPPGSTLDGAALAPMPE